MGEIRSPSRYDADLGWSIKDVAWSQQVNRDSVSTSTRNSLGSIATLFTIQDSAAADMRRHAGPIGLVQTADLPPLPDADTSIEEESVILQEVGTKAREFLEDRIAKLDWEQMQELVSEILRAMGYRARVAPKGADRGVDIIASPDGLGLQEPRIFVEVKHRPGTQISADQVRSFIGGRQSGDRCLYVSTGGFSKDARYEAERSSIPLTLITLPELRELLTEYYDKFSPAGAALIPLERVYWPIS